MGSLAREIVWPLNVPGFGATCVDTVRSPSIAASLHLREVFALFCHHALRLYRPVHAAIRTRP